MTVRIIAPQPASPAPQVRRFLILLCIAVTAASNVAIARGEPPELRQGDWTVVGHEVHRGKHIRLDGSLILPAGSQLTLEDCRLEILGRFSREHAVQWQGGTLVTRRCTVGGIVAADGRAIHTVFHLYDGHWEAIDTTVQYSYGVSFHWSKGKGVLRGTRMMAGPRPDAIILSGEADVELVDSRFPIGLGLYCDQGGRTELNLPRDQWLTRTYSQNNTLPAVKWRLTLRHTRVDRWFLFVRQIGDWHPPADISLLSGEHLIVSLLGHNLQGTVELSGHLDQPLKIGNVTLHASQQHEPIGIDMYALYFSGDKTDVTIAGQAHICEFMHRGGRVRVAGPAGRHALRLGCTTLEMSGNAQLKLENVWLGSRQVHGSGVGEANIHDRATLTGTGVVINGVRFRTQDSGSVDLDHVQLVGHAAEQISEGGPIHLRTDQHQ